GPGQAFNSLVSVVEAALTLGGFLAALLVVSPVMAAVLLVATIPGIFAEASIARQRAGMLLGTSHAWRRRYFYATLLSSLEAAKEIRLFGLGSFFRTRMLEELDVIHRSGERVDRRQAVSLSVPSGRAVALVGRNGAGKSTLVKLMCRFYDPDRGRILWDGVDLRDLDPGELRVRISAVFQDYMTYELTARENIAVGD